MQFTIFGIVWVVINLIFLLVGMEYQIYLLLFSCVLQANTCISTDGFCYGTPTLIVAAFIIIRFILQYLPISPFLYLWVKISNHHVRNIMEECQGLLM